MVSLVDIGPSKGTVELRGQQLDLIGLTAKHIVGIMISFPEVRKILAQREADLGTLVAQFPLAVGMIIAAGTGHADEQEHIDIAQELPVGEQYDILAKLMELSFPKGPQSFLDGVEAALRRAGVPGWDQATKLPEQSSPVSEQDDEKRTAGTAPPSS